MINYHKNPTDFCLATYAPTLRGDLNERDIPKLGDADKAQIQICLFHQTRQVII